MAIVKLDKHTAELIAAGEVVERPASVIKELVENAIDAGAGAVAIEVQRGGVALMQVSDDGSGIEAADLPLAFVRHATSKLRAAEDLTAIETLGFRGEALASIASVARVEVLTRHDADEFASRCVTEGGSAPRTETAARPRGTTVTVRELFYNTPARMKFLKKDASEGTYVTETVTRLALSHPEVAFRYSREGRQVLATPGDGDLAAAVWAALGREFAKGLQPVDAASANGAYRVHGLVTAPLAGRASRGMQFFYINGRYVKNRTMMAALEQAYRGMAMQGKFPGCVLFLEMPAELVDVNVHPAKTEVRFAREGEVFDAVYRAVKAALMDAAGTHGTLKLANAAGAAGDGAGDVTPSATPGRGMELRRAAKGDTGGTAVQLGAYNTMLKDAAVAAEALESSAGFVPYVRANPVPPPAFAGRRADGLPKPVPASAMPLAGSEATKIFNVKLNDFTESTATRQTTAGDSYGRSEACLNVEYDEPAGQTRLEAEGETTGESLRLVGEIFKTYIVAEVGERLCMIDKHAAHERILYEQIDAALARQSVAVQQLLAPVAVALNAAEKDALLQNEELLAAIGLEAEDFGGVSVLVRGVPADIEPGDVEAMVVEVASRLAVNARDSRTEKLQWVLHSIACRAAVKAGDDTPPQALLALAADILAGRVPPFCPHGRPVVLEISRRELEKQFGRLG